MPVVVIAFLFVHASTLVDWDLGEHTVLCLWLQREKLKLPHGIFADTLLMKTLGLGSNRATPL